MSVGTNADGTSAEALEARLREQNVVLGQLNTRLANAVADKDRFLAHVSHEIRTPLNGVLGFLRVLAATPLTTPQREYVRSATQSGETLMTLLNELLECGLERRYSGQMVGKPFDLCALAEGITANFASLASEKTVALTLTYAPHLPRFVAGHELGMRQILNNLVYNAVKFTHQGSVRVNIDGMMRVGGLVDLSIVVSDTGSGMSPEQLPGLFEGTGRTDAEERRARGGAGLGLGIVRSLVEGMRGTISVSSTLGVGTAFEVLVQLPVDRRVRRFASLAVDSKGPGVLVVVGGESDAVALEELLRRMRVWVDVTADIDDAASWLLAASNHRPYDIAILLTHDAVRCGLAEILHACNTPVITSGFSAGDRRALADSKVRVLADFPVGATDRLVDCVREELRLSASTTDDPSADGSSSCGLRREAHGHADASSSREDPEVLLVDDEPMNLFVLSKLLHLHGVRAVTAESAESALSVLNERTFAAVFMDMRMPGMSGTQASERIRAREHDGGLPRVPIIAATANTAASDREACAAAGMDYVLSKPLDPDDLLYVVKRWIFRTIPDERADSTSAATSTHADDELTALFVESAEQRLRELRDALACGNPETASIAAHTIKSMSRHMGFEELGQVGSAIELSVRAGGLTGCHPLVSRAEELYVAAKATLSVEPGTKHETVS